MCVRAQIEQGIGSCKSKPNFNDKNFEKGNGNDSIVLSKLLKKNTCSFSTFVVYLYILKGIQKRHHRKGGDEMAVYLIDGDNGPTERIKGIECLSNDEQVQIFFGTKNPYYVSEQNQKKVRERTAATVVFFPIPAGKNAVDFAIAVRAGCFAAKAEETIVYLVSLDRDFQLIANAVQREKFADFQLKKIENILQGVAANPRGMTNLQTIYHLLMEEFGSQAGQALYQRTKELFYAQFQLTEKCKREHKKSGAAFAIFDKLMQRCWKRNKSQNTYER